MEDREKELINGGQRDGADQWKTEREELIIGEQREKELINEGQRIGANQ